MNEIDKFLRKLSVSEREDVVKTIDRIIKLKLEGLDVKKLKGVSNVFRARKGRIRIQYGASLNGDVIILSVTYRNDTTYNF